MMTKYKKLEKRVEELEVAVKDFQNFWWFNILGTMGELSNENCKLQEELEKLKQKETESNDRT